MADEAGKDQAQDEDQVQDQKKAAPKKRLKGSLQIDGKSYKAGDTLPGNVSKATIATLKAHDMVE